MLADVVVIGAGVGGLAAAIALASQGVGVTVLERADAVGGKAGTAEVDGVRFDTGPSVLTLPQVFRDLFADAGVDFDREVTLRELSPGFRYIYADGVSLDVHHSMERTAAAIEAALGAGPRREFEDFLAYAGGIWELAAPEFIWGPAPDPWKLARLGPARLLRFRGIDPLRSMRTAIERRVKSEHLRMLLLRYATYNGSDPRRAPATLNCIAHVELALGGYGVEGGIEVLVGQMVRLCHKLGVVIRTQAAVRRVLVNSAGVTGVELDGGAKQMADAVVSNADAAHLLRDLLPLSVDPGVRIPGTASMSGWTAVARARRAVRAPHTVLFPSHYDQEFVDIFDHARPPTVPTVYACAQEATHGRSGWPEHEPVFLMANAPTVSDDPVRDDRSWAALRLAVVERSRDAGLLAEGDELVWTRTPRGLAERFPGSHGALYGGASNSLFAAFQRPPNRVPRIRGLYIASGTAHPGGGLPLVVQSGRQAARALVEDLRVTA